MTQPGCGPPRAPAGRCGSTPAPATPRTARPLQTLHEQALLDVPDPEVAAAAFAYAAVGPLQDRALLTGEAPSSAAVERYAAGAARAFLAAHRLR